MQSMMETDAGDQGVASAAHEAAAALPNDIAEVRLGLPAACAMMSSLHVVLVLSETFTAWPKGGNQASPALTSTVAGALKRFLGR